MQRNFIHNEPELEVTQTSISLTIDKYIVKIHILRNILFAQHNCYYPNTVLNQCHLTQKSTYNVISFSFSSENRRLIQTEKADRGLSPGQGHEENSLESAVFD